MNLKTIAVFLLTTLSLTAGAQNSFFGEVMEVRVTNVDVIVTSKDGKPVKGLTRDDFELYEDGVKKEITNFLEIQEETLPAELTPAAPTETPQPAPVASDDVRRRSIVVFFDNAALHPFRRKEIISRLRDFMQKTVRHGDEVAIITWDRSLKAELDATSDRAALEAALTKIETRTSSGNQAATDLKNYKDQVMFTIRSYEAAGETPPWGEVIGHARAYAMGASSRARQRAEALKAVAASMRGVSGRKILVFVTAAFSQNPSEVAFAWLDGLRERFGNPPGRAMDEAKDFELTGLINDIADAANSAGVSLYPIDGGGKDAGMSGFIDATSNETIQSTPILVADTGAITMNSIAAETGGVALYGSTNWQLAFDTIASDLNTYYSLGYRSDGARQDKLKKITVKLKNKRYNVRSRRAVIEPSVSSEMTDAVASHLFRDIRTNDLAIRASAGAAGAVDGESTVIPLTITIPTEKLTLLPDGTDLTGSFSIFAVFLRRDGKVSDVARQPQAFRFPAESLKRRKEITVKIDLKTDPNTDGISIGVMDEASRATGFAAVKLGG